jgi:hypothetical protein
MIKIYENLLQPEFVDYIEKWTTSSGFSWHKGSENYGTLSPKHSQPHLKNEDVIESFQLTHTFISYDNSTFDKKDHEFGELFLKNVFGLLREEYEVNKFAILRCKANLMPKQLRNNENCRNPPHVDLFEPHLVVLYYVNDSDGDTFLYEKGTTDNIIQRISPKKGKLVIFDGDYYHSSSPPQKNTVRIVINSDIILN